MDIRKKIKYGYILGVILLVVIAAYLVERLKPDAQTPVFISLDSQKELSVRFSLFNTYSIKLLPVNPESNIQIIRNNYPGNLLIIKLDDDLKVYELQNNKNFQINVDKNISYRTIDIDEDTVVELHLNIPSTPFVMSETPDVSVSTLQSTMNIIKTPSAAGALKAAFDEIDKQFQNTLKSGIAFNKPEQMKKDETTSIELILNPSLSESDLATQIIERGNFITSTADPDVLIAPNGGMVTVQTSQIEITQRTKTVLLPQDPEAFIVKDMHDNPEQVISSVETTAWRWSVTAKKEGSQTLELVIYQLVKYDGKDYWHEVETYKANILVEVTAMDRVKSWNWYSIIGAVVAVVGSVLGVWKWLDERKKKVAENKSSAPVRRIK